MTKPIKIRRGPAKGTTITIASQLRTTRLAPEVDRILAALGVTEALVTDETKLSHFLPLSPAAVERMAVLFPAGYDEHDYVADLAERLSGAH